MKNKDNNSYISQQDIDYYLKNELQISKQWWQLPLKIKKKHVKDAKKYLNKLKFIK